MQKLETMINDIVSQVRFAGWECLCGKRANARQPTVGAAEGCDLLIFSDFRSVTNQDQKIAAFGSSYRGIYAKYRFLEARNAKTRFRGFL
ncbi:hypothetical protein [Pseudomonas sp. ES3-33]|uniref:hypothetical protein n=1 Tax=Pseudomonas sp. ES3-33 TaxID=1628833 RepID=UPI00128C61D2|nr:hypothetical protein [Pseudomonas sp. ES3-33]